LTNQSICCGDDHRGPFGR